MKAEYVHNRKLIEEQSILSHGRKLFVAGALKSDGYNELKREYLDNTKCLKRELSDINIKLKDVGRQNELSSRSFTKILQGVSSLDIADKKHLVSLISPR